MATLPDIDTTGVSFIAYWNAIDQGGLDVTTDTWEPSDVTSYGNVQSVTTYDNGVEGTLSMGNGLESTYRVKSDGWVLVYNDRSHNYTGSTGTKPSGYWSVAQNMMNPGNTAGVDVTQFDLEIQGLFNSTSASDLTSASINLSDVNLYNYEWGGATNASLISMSDSTGGGSSDYGVTFTGTYNYTDTTEIKNQAITVALNSTWNNNSRAGVVVDGSDVIIADTADVGRPAYGVHDAADLGFAQTAGTDHTLKMELGQTDTQNYYGQVCSFAIWS